MQWLSNADPATRIEDDASTEGDGTAGSSFPFSDVDFNFLREVRHVALSSEQDS